MNAVSDRLNIYNGRHRLEQTFRNLSQEQMTCQENKVDIERFLTFYQAENLSADRHPMHTLSSRPCCDHTRHLQPAHYSNKNQTRNGYFLSECCNDATGPVVQTGMPQRRWAKERPVCKAEQPTKPEGRGFESRPVHH